LEISSVDFFRAERVVFNGFSPNAFVYDVAETQN
jgi:hypothetical protein